MTDYDPAAVDVLIERCDVCGQVAVVERTATRRLLVSLSATSGSRLWATHNGPVSLITWISRSPGVRRLVRRHKSEGVVAESPDSEDRHPPSSSTKPVPSRLANP